MPDLDAETVLTRDSLEMTPKLQALCRGLSDGEKLRCIYEFAGSLLDRLHCEEDTIMCDMMEDLSQIRNSIEYCGLI